MATKIERVYSLLEGIEQDVRKATVTDIRIDLREMLKDCKPASGPVSRQ